MGFFSMLNGQSSRRGLLRRTAARRLQLAPLSPRRLERRRVLDAGAAELLLGAPLGPSDYVQTSAPANMPATEPAAPAAGASALAVSSSDLIVTPLQFSSFENDEARVYIIFVDNANPATQVFDIDWGDGSALERFERNNFPSILVSHRYRDDDPTATTQDVYQLRVLTLDGNQFGESTAVLVENLPPKLTVAGDQTLNEGSLLDLTGGRLGQFRDVGTLDTHSATVDWGDGNATEVVLINQGQGAGSLDASHTYADNGVYTVTVTLNDDDGGSDAGKFKVHVKNVAPTLTVVGTQTVDEGALLEITDLGTFTDPGFDNLLNTQDPTNGEQTRERFFYKIDWGDSTFGTVQVATIDQPGGPGMPTTGSFDGSHIYADNGLYTVRVQLLDDDNALALQTFQVQVNNIEPTLAGIDNVPAVNEGQAFTLNDLGTTLTDPGFDNPFNPLNLSGSQETFDAVSIDWGDGTPPTALNIVNRVNGDRGVATTAEFEHASHTYADNGLYTVTLHVSDDDGGTVARTFQIRVNNVAPTLELTDRDLEIRESDTLNLFDLGVFSDPGFNNALNVGDPSNSGEVAETFSYSIDWGDGTVETGQLPASVLDGSASAETIGTLVNSHQYLDNDADNLYTITVTLNDDDGGSVTKEITVRVLNVNPTLEPITATDVNTSGETTLTLEFTDPGTETLTVWIDWGDQLHLPPAQRFVPETVVLGPGMQNLTLLHTYAGPPDPLHPAADIIISTFIRDDDFDFPGVVDPGQSETYSVAISNPGLGVTPIVIDTTPQVPRLIFPKTEESFFIAGGAAGGVGSVQTADLRTAVGDTKSATDRFLELCVIDPASGEESEGYRLKPEVLNNLPALFQTLPDNRYAIYLVRTETNTRRLVIEVYVRNGKLIDPGDDSEGTRDRPPTDEATQEPQQALQQTLEQLESGQLPVEIKQELEPEFQPEVEPAELPKPDSEQPDAAPGESPVKKSAQSMIPQYQQLLGTAVAGLVAARSGRAWAERVDRTIAGADAKKWQQLRRRNPNKRKKG